VKKDVDKWHFDSVDYVMVLILSNMDGMVGGELEVYNESLGSPEDTKAMARQGGPPRDKVKTVSYQKSGWAIFAQGSKIMHRVAPVLAASEPRISFVFSLMSADVMEEDRTRTLKVNKDPENI